MTTRRMPSETQENILAFIWNYLQTFKRPPAYREIKEAIGASSVSVVSHHVRQLERMGMLERDENVARGLSLTDEARALLGKITDAVYEAASVVHFQIRGEIRAGEPVQMGHDSFPDNDPEDSIVVDAGLLPGRRDNLYALRVRGDSMVDALVNAGDIVILEKVSEARNGDMVAVWLHHREETTLKRFYLEGKTVRLQPANPNHDPIIVPAADVLVQGRVVLVQRQFGSKASFN